MLNITLSKRCLKIYQKYAIPLFRALLFFKISSNSERESIYHLQKNFRCWNAPQGAFQQRKFEHFSRRPRKARARGIAQRNKSISNLNLYLFCDTTFLPSATHYHSIYAKKHLNTFKNQRDLSTFILSR